MGIFKINILESSTVQLIPTPNYSSPRLNAMRCDVLASQRKDMYTTYLVVNAKGDFIKSSYSRCSCPAGNLFCAHMLGLMCLCHIAQKRPTWNRSALAKMMPTHVPQLQRTIIPVCIIFAKRMNSNSKSIA